ncbi:MAG: ATP-binding protein [Planctomycetota bacterium]|nr:ATP-binding protein [Planctomycetota bacterium]
MFTRRQREERGGVGASAPEPPPATFDRRRLVVVPAAPARSGLLAGMRIRKKLVFLHTLFSLALATILLVAVRPAIRAVVEKAELEEARVVLDALTPSLSTGEGVRRTDDAASRLAETALVRTGGSMELGLTPESASAAIAADGRAVVGESIIVGPCAVSHTPARAGQEERFHVLTVRISSARRAVTDLYLLLVGALVAVYALIAVAMEVFVLPRTVYEPVRRMLAADAAAREGRTDGELIPADTIPADEIGAIMSSRNETVMRLRAKEAALADALSKLESVATDLRRKNHLLEAARRNLADADRLASLGMMSAGIAHELNTPLAVLKGLVERLNANPARGMEPTQAALMLRVVSRLERLGESLLDFARVRPPRTRETVLRTVVQEAITLVRLDRETGTVDLRNAVSEGVVASCDPDRMVQVLVNLVRNGVDAVRAGTRAGGRVWVEGETVERDGRAWVSLRVRDDGPGFDPDILPRLFEPFASTRLDARGTGLGLAVAEGIVREHGGVLLARNRVDGPGAELEVMIPREQATLAPVPSAGPVGTQE